MQDGFSVNELQHYLRQINLEEIGLDGQSKLKKASILVIGAGGLGCPILQYLTAAGVGRIGIVEDDKIEITNLHRQILYSARDVGKFKVDIAKQILEDLNPNVEIQIFKQYLSLDNANDLFNDFDIIIDGSDNFATKYLINDLCVKYRKPLVYGSISQFDGHVSVFNLLDKDGNLGPNYRDLFPTSPPANLSQNCSEGGVIGILPGIIGCLQGLEAIKIILGVGVVTSGQLLIFDSLNMIFRKVTINKRQSNQNKIVDSQSSLVKNTCNINTLDTDSINPTELSKIIKNKDIQIKLVDVRSTQEHNDISIGGENIPINELPSQLGDLSKNEVVIFYCKSGARSKNAVSLLKEYSVDTKCLNLAGGILAYIADGHADGLRGRFYSSIIQK